MVATIKNIPVVLGFLIPTILGGLLPDDWNWEHGFSSYNSFADVGSLEHQNLINHDREEKGRNSFSLIHNEQNIPDQVDMLRPNIAHHRIFENGVFEGTARHGDLTSFTHPNANNGFQIFDEKMLEYHPLPSNHEDFMYFDFEGHTHIPNLDDPQRIGNPQARRPPRSQEYKGQEKGHNSFSLIHNEQNIPDQVDMLRPNIAHHRIPFEHGMFKGSKSHEDLTSFTHPDVNNGYQSFHKRIWENHLLPSPHEDLTYIDFGGHTQIPNLDDPQKIGDPQARRPLSSQEFNPGIQSQTLASSEIQQICTPTCTMPSCGLIEGCQMHNMMSFGSETHGLNSLLLTGKQKNQPASPNVKLVEKSGSIPDPTEPLPLNSMIPATMSSSMITPLFHHNPVPEAGHYCDPKHKITTYQQNLEVSDLLERPSEYPGLFQIFARMGSKEEATARDLVCTNFNGYPSSIAEVVANNPSVHLATGSSDVDDAVHRMVYINSNKRKRKDTVSLTHKEKCVTKEPHLPNDSDEVPYVRFKEQNYQDPPLHGMQQHCMAQVKKFCESQGIEEKLNQVISKAEMFISKVYEDLLQHTSEDLISEMEKSIEKVIRRFVFEITFKFMGILMLLNSKETPSKLFEDGWKFMTGILEDWCTMYINPEFELDDIRSTSFFDLSEPKLLFRYLLKTKRRPFISTSIYWHLWKDWYRSSKYQSKKMIQNEENFWNELYIGLTQQKDVDIDCNDRPYLNPSVCSGSICLLPQEAQSSRDGTQPQFQIGHSKKKGSYSGKADGNIKSIDISPIACKIGSAEFEQLTLSTTIDRWFDQLGQELKPKLLASSFRDSVKMQDITGAIHRFYLHIIPTFFGALVVLNPEHFKRDVSRCDIIQDGWVFFKKKLEECKEFDPENYVRQKRLWKTSDELYIPYLFYSALNLAARRSTVNLSILWRLYLLWYKESSLSNITHTPKFHEFKNLFSQNYSRYFSTGFPLNAIQRSGK
ncbi:hypothetical protein DFH28DRAFT_965420 [Melampsora americana]|nr:hypothetical protein DFH28DRAFT_965420 [Melampsora americana]